MGPILEVVEGAGLTRATVSHLAKVTASKATAATARAPTTTLAPTTREATAATVKPSQVERDGPSAAAPCRTVHIRAGPLIDLVD